MKDVSVVIVTGLSGSGKNTALHDLEDLGYYAVDNLPLQLLPKLLELTHITTEFSRFALLMDAREPEFADLFEETFRQARADGIDISLLFMDADDATLLRRYADTKRRHPLDHDDGGDLRALIAREREQLARLRDLASMVIDTSKISIHDLKRILKERFTVTGRHPMHVSLMSFSAKKGVPTDANLVIDVRFLPNPYYVPELKDRTGLDPDVADYVLSHEAARKLVENFGNLLRFLLPYYEKEGKAYLTVAVGCTGGVHRSVAIVEALGRLLADGRHRITVTHRELNRHHEISRPTPDRGNAD
ncbi:RNase adapter RapZ [bacterium]|nr:RNase adapter RapZ [bacterium]